MNSKEKEREFLKELKALLKKYGVAIHAYRYEDDEAASFLSRDFDIGFFELEEKLESVS